MNDPFEALAAMKVALEEGLALLDGASVDDTAGLDALARVTASIVAGPNPATLRAAVPAERLEEFDDQLEAAAAQRRADAGRRARQGPAHRAPEERAPGESSSTTGGRPPGRAAAATCPPEAGEPTPRTPRSRRAGLPRGVSRPRGAGVPAGAGGRPTSAGRDRSLAEPSAHGDREARSDSFPVGGTPRPLVAPPGSPGSDPGFT